METIIEEYGSFSFTVKSQFEVGKEFKLDEKWEFKLDKKIYKTVTNHRNSDKSILKVNPMMCRLRDLNYQSEVKLDLTFMKYQVREDGSEQAMFNDVRRVHKIPLAEIPVMVRSKWCRLN